MRSVGHQAQSAINTRIFGSAKGVSAKQSGPNFIRYGRRRAEIASDPGMSKKDLAQVVDFSDIKVRRAWMEKIQRLDGLYEVSFKPRKLVRSLSQNNYYFVAVCQPFRDWLREVYGDPQIDIEQAHEMLKVRILGMNEKLIDSTGEVLMLIPRSKTLDTWEFAQYIEKCAEFLASFCGIVVIPAEMFYEQKEAKPKRTLAQDLGESVMIAKSAKRKRTA